MTSQMTRGEPGLLDDGLPWGGRRLLGIFAHPDDETFCAGGTFARYAEHGAEIMVVSATRGQAGQICDAAVGSRRTIAAVREAELRLACERLGPRGTLALLGGGLAVLALAHAARFGRLDRAVPAPDPEAGLLYHLPMFAPLPLAVTDLLAAEVKPRRFPAGAVVTREGDAGDRFYLITDGSATVSVRGAPRPSLQRGDCFGEIALLHDIPRTATVTAEQPLRTLTLGREEFLTAVTGNSTSEAAAHALAGQRLSADPPGRADGPARA